MATRKERCKQVHEKVFVRNIDVNGHLLNEQTPWQWNGKVISELNEKVQRKVESRNNT